MESEDLADLEADLAPDVEGQLTSQGLAVDGPQGVGDDTPHDGQEALAAAGPSVAFDPRDHESLAAHFNLPADEVKAIVELVASCFDADGAAELLKVAYQATKPGGRTVVIVLFLSQAKSNLAECIEVLKLDTETRGGGVRTVEQIESELKEAGFSEVQLAFMSKSKARLGMAVATKAADSDSE